MRRQRLPHRPTTPHPCVLGTRKNLTPNSSIDRVQFFNDDLVNFLHPERAAEEDSPAIGFSGRTLRSLCTRPPAKTERFVLLSADTLTTIFAAEPAGLK